MMRPLPGGRHLKRSIPSSVWEELVLEFAGFSDFQSEILGELNLKLPKL
jgi:hypothetical protein